MRSWRAGLRLRACIETMNPGAPASRRRVPVGRGARHAGETPALPGYGSLNADTSKVFGSLLGSSLFAVKHPPVVRDPLVHRAVLQPVFDPAFELLLSRRLGGLCRWGR